MLCRLQIVSYLQRCYNTSIDYDNYYQLTNSIVYKVIYYESRESMNRLKAQQVEIGYGDRSIINNLDVEIPDGKVTSIIGPNGCGKSTLLKALSRLLTIKNGEIQLDGQNIHTQSTKEIAKNCYITTNTRSSRWSYSRRISILWSFSTSKGFGRLSAEDKKRLIGL